MTTTSPRRRHTRTRLATGVLLQLVMGVAVVAIAVVIYPVLRRGTERLGDGLRRGADA